MIFFCPAASPTHMFPQQCAIRKAGRAKCHFLSIGYYNGRIGYHQTFDTMKATVPAMKI